MLVINDLKDTIELDAKTMEQTRGGVLGHTSMYAEERANIVTRGDVDLIQDNPGEPGGQLEGEEIILKMVRPRGGGLVPADWY